MRNTWRTFRIISDIRLKNWAGKYKWRFIAQSEPDVWVIDLRDENAGEFGLTIASVRLRKLTPTIWLSEKLWVNENFRGQGFSKQLFDVQKAFLTQVLQGSVLQALVRDDNEVQVKRLQELGWKRVAGYRDEACFDASIWLYSPWGDVLKPSEETYTFTAVQGEEECGEA